MQALAEKITGADFQAFKHSAANAMWVKLEEDGRWSTWLALEAATVVRIEAKEGRIAAVRFIREGEYRIV